MISRAVEITSSTGAIIYDGLLLALAEEVDTVMVTADDTLLRILRETPFAGRTQRLDEAPTLP